MFIYPRREVSPFTNIIIIETNIVIYTLTFAIRDIISVKYYSYSFKIIISFNSN